MTLFPEKYLSVLQGSGEILSTYKLPLGDLIFLTHHGADSDAAREYLLEKLKSD
jgi:hypothetical protein